MTESEDSVSTNASPTSSPASSPASSLASSPTTLSKSPVKKKEVAVTVQKPTLAHPSTAVMVTTAIKTLNDKKGSTLQSIKKYLASNYQVNLTKFSPFICKYLKTAVAKGNLIQTKGSGALGNFKLPIQVKKPAVKKKKAVIVAVPAVTKKKPDAKKTTAVKTATSGKRNSIEGTKLNAKKSKKVTTSVVKPKSKTVKKVVTKNSPTKPKKVGSAAIKSKTSKVVVKKTPVKKAAPKKK